MEVISRPTSGTEDLTYQRFELLGDGEYLGSERIK